MMSEELQDEIEALNSIYGESTVTPSDSPDTFILTLPSSTSTLKLHFPALYPSAPPSILGTHSAGEHSRPGEAAQDLSLFVRALSAVFAPGQVCLFDAIEEHTRLVEEQQPAEGQAAAGDAVEDEPEVEEDMGRPRIIAPTGPIPPWVLSSVFVEQKSTFIARCALVKSPDQAKQYLEHLLASDKRVRTATHNITAWRIRGDGGASFQDCDDDGETAAGGRLLHLMQLMDIWDVMVVVTRWYGGLKLGPRRFALINQVARDAFVNAGLVPEGKKKGK